MALAYLKICTDTEHPLHRKIIVEKRNMLKRGKIWMGRADIVVRQACEVNNISTGAEWVPVHP